jgi:hypothetical protein
MSSDRTSSEDSDPDQKARDAELMKEHGPRYATY